MRRPDGGYLPPYRDPGKFSFSRVVANARALGFENLGSLVVIGLLVSAVPRLAIFFAALIVLPMLSPSTLPVQFLILALLIGSLTIHHLLPSYLLVGAVGEQVGEAMAGKRIRILPALRSAIFHAPAMTVSALGIGLITVISMPLLFVPAFAIVPLMLPAPAASVMRKQGLRLAFAETATIAKGNRWAIILAGGGWMAGVGVVGQGSEFLLTTAKTIGADPSAAWFLAPALLLLALESIIGACFSIAIYVEARRVADHKWSLDRVADA